MYKAIELLSQDISVLKGYIKIPEEFNEFDLIPFAEYLCNKNVSLQPDNVNVYDLNTTITSENFFGKDTLKVGNGSTDSKKVDYKDLSDDFNDALYSQTYYPTCDHTDYLKRLWATVYIKPTK